jgi:hypothetical protein
MSTFTSVPFRREQRGGGKFSWLTGLVKKAAKKPEIYKNIFGVAASKAPKVGLRETLKNPTLRKELAKKVGKKAAKEVGKGALELGSAVVMDQLEGGEGLSRRDVGQLSKEAGLSLLEQAASGKKITSKSVRDEVRRATESKLRSKPRTGRYRNSNWATRLKELQKFLHSTYKQQKSRRTAGNPDRRIISYDRPFGTGIKKRKKPKKKRGGKKRGRKPKRSKRSSRGKKRTVKKKGKKRGKKRFGGRKKKSFGGARSKRGRKQKLSAGLKRMNLAASKARYAKMRDVFDI